jgi:futalosine hydrolase
MKILVVAATFAEVKGIYEHFDCPPAAYMQSQAFDILITGVGMTATAYALGKTLSAQYQLVLNLGIAGSFDYTINLGSLVQVIEDEFSELGAQTKDSFLTLNELGFGKTVYERSFTGHHPLLNTLPQVKGITVNQVHGNDAAITAIINRLHPATESMEGAAVFYACEQAAIPCLQVRAISNHVEERNKENWKIGLAIKNLNQWAIEFLLNFTP